MKNSHNPERLFREAERLEPPPGLWRRIAERSPLAAMDRPERSLWEAPMLRAAAAVALAATVLGLAALGLSRFQGGNGDGAAMASAPVLEETALADDEEVFDPELLGWQADLGELELEAEEAEEEVL